MNGSLLQLLVLAGIAIFLILKLRSVLGTREGFEKPAQSPTELRPQAAGRTFEVIEGGADHDIIDHVAEGSAAAKALAEMKRAEPSFAVTPFLSGARQAYEMILMAFERGDLAAIRPFLSADVAESFAEVIETRKAQGLSIDATFIGLKELSLETASYNPATRLAEITVRFVGELTQVITNAAGEVVEGDAKTVKRQRDIWTFARKMGDADPNWQLIATGE